MTDKYVGVDANGNLAEVPGQQSSAGVADAGKIPALASNGRFDPSLMPDGYDAEADSITTTEDLSAGALVNIYNASGIAKVRNADASAANGAKRAHGFVLQSFNNGESALVYRFGRNSSMSSLTPGTEYFLSGTTPGAVTATPPTTPGHLCQMVGEGVSATELDFKPTKGVIRA